MRNNFPAIIKQEDDWWIGWVEEIPGVNCQEKTPEALKKSLEVTLLMEASAAIGEGYRAEFIAV